MAEGVKYTSPQTPPGFKNGSDDLSHACDVCLQVSIAVATLATAGFITLAALHYFTVASAMVASFTGVADIILIAVLSCKKCILETPPSELSAHTSQPDQIPADSLMRKQPTQLLANPDPAPSLHLAKLPVIRPPNPLSAKEWEQRLTILPPNPNFCGYNLIDPTQPPAPQAKNECIALPTLGNYKKEYLDLPHRPALGVRLPSSQLPAFPQNIQNLFQADSEIELYFLIYDDSGAMGTQRNLVLHHMVLPEYDNQKSLWCPIEIGIFESQGVEKPKNDINFLADNRLVCSHVHLHPDPDDPTLSAISPDNCILVPSPKAPVSSFYTAARFRGCAVAFYTLLIQNRQSPEGKTILEASQHKPFSVALQALQAENSPCAAEVKKLFAYYP